MKLTKCERCLHGYFEKKGHRCERPRKIKLHKILLDENGEVIPQSQKN